MTPVQGSQAKKRGAVGGEASTSKKTKRAAVDDVEEQEFSSDSSLGVQSRKHLAAAAIKPKAPRKVRPYIPAKRSGAYAIILALGSTIDDEFEAGRTLTKGEIEEVGAEWSDKSFQTSGEPGKYHSAWSRCVFPCPCACLLAGLIHPFALPSAPQHEDPYRVCGPSRQDSCQGGRCSDTGLIIFSSKGLVCQHGRPARFNLSDTGVRLAEVLKDALEEESDRLVPQPPLPSSVASVAASSRYAMDAHDGKRLKQTKSAPITSMGTCWDDPPAVNEARLSEIAPAGRRLDSRAALSAAMGREDVYDGCIAATGPATAIIASAAAAAPKPERFWFHFVGESPGSAISYLLPTAAEHSCLSQTAPTTASNSGMRRAPSSPTPANTSARSSSGRPNSASPSSGPTSSNVNKLRRDATSYKRTTVGYFSPTSRAPRTGFLPLRLSRIPCPSHRSTCLKSLRQQKFQFQL